VTTTPEPALVLGLGNELFSDEGIGVAAMRGLAQQELPGVDTVDGGTLGVELLPTVAGRTHLLIFDAVTSQEAKPGDILVLTADEVRAGHQILFSAHQIGISQVLAAAELAGHSVTEIAGVGMAPFSLETGYGITPEAEQRLPKMVAVGRDILVSWGVIESSGRMSHPNA
jgi:hydrogenase maturation protease